MEEIITRKLIEIYYERDESAAVGYYKCKKCMNPKSRKCNSGYGNLLRKFQC